jgi:hypothetical protein
MGRFVKKVLILSAVVFGFVAVARVLKRRHDESMPGYSTPGQSTPGSSTSPQWPVIPDPASDWLPPLEGGCPAGYAIKVNTTSGIYHVPEGRSYQRTVAQRCYATAEAAERDGYRRAKA